MSSITPIPVPTFRLKRLRFHCKAREPIRLPPYAGSAWRGLIGSSLRRSVCVTRQPTCEGCLLRTQCAYSTFFESPPASPEDAGQMLKRRLQLDLPNAQEVDSMSWRSLLRAGAEQGLIQDLDAWMVYRDKRNITSHTYNEAKAIEVAAVVPDFAHDAQSLLRRLRARGADANA